MKKILIISNNDSVWLKPAWAKVINSDNNLFEFNLITLPEKKLKNMNPAVYYFRSFGAKNFIFLSIFSIVRNIKFYKTNKKTFSKDICMKLNLFLKRKYKASLDLKCFCDVDSIQYHKNIN